MNWIQRKIHIYNVTFGLFMLDWWERYLFNILVIVLMWFIFYNGSRYVTDFFQSYYVAISERTFAEKYQHIDFELFKRYKLFAEWSNPKGLHLLHLTMSSVKSA